MIHTLYRRATHTFHTPSCVTSYLLLVFLSSSSSFQSVFSEQTRVRASTKISTPVVQTGLQVDQTSTYRERQASSKFQSRSTNQPRFNQARQTSKGQDPSDSMASRSCTELAPGSCLCHPWDLETKMVSSGHLTGQNDKPSSWQNLTSPKVHKASNSQRK